MARVHQISASGGGVPKLAIESAVVDESGIVGDMQADRVHHGHPHQALCLFSLEVIERFQAEGHPVSPGVTGENITIVGLDWAEVVPGILMTIGPVEVEITKYTSPCYKNAQWFLEGRFDRMHADKHPGESRVYARIVKSGLVTTGDPVSLLT